MGKCSQFVFGVAAMRIGYVGMISLCSMVISIPSVKAQTRSEAADFIFRNASEINGLGGVDNSKITVSENSCVVTLRGAYTTNEGDLVTTQQVIDFNKLAMSSAVVYNDGAIEISGQDNAVVDSKHYRSDNQTLTWRYDKLKLSFDSLALEKRVENALSYFTKFCPGKSGF